VSATDTSEWKESEASRQALLRTSCDVAEHALVQLRALAEEWPEYAKDVSSFERFVGRLSTQGLALGHVRRARL
jgi:hypothetical protein